MNQPSDHANAAWRTPGGATPQAIEGAIIAFNQELIGEIDRLRTENAELNKNPKMETFYLLQKAVEAQCNATNEAKSLGQDAQIRFIDANKKANALQLALDGLEERHRRTAAIHETTKTALLDRINKLTAERDRLSEELAGARRGKTIVFDVQHFGERAAGLNPWTDVVTINVRDGAIDGIEGEFVEAIQPALAEFFDGCAVTVAHPEPTKE